MTEHATRARPWTVPLIVWHDGAGDHTSDDSREAQRHVFAGVRLILLGVTAVLQVSLGFGSLLTYPHHPAARYSLAASVLVTLVCAIRVVRRKPLPTPVVVGGVVTMLTASAVATAVLPPHAHFGPTHWLWGQVGWSLLLLLLDRVPALLAALAAHVVLGVGQWLLAGAPDRAEIGNAGVVVLSVTSLQLGALVMTRFMLRNAAQAVEVAAERERAATRAALAEQWDQDLRAGFAGQLGATLPLLADLADGVLDPRADDTRQRCALAATQLRRLFAENDDVPDPLVHEVTACVHVAERRGVAVSLAVSGAPVPVPTDVRRELTGPLAEALSAARERARVSLLRTGGEVRVAVVADAGVEVGTTRGRVEVECGTYGRHTRMEARWRTS
ncbi:hypothetical protein ACFYOT_21010 [Saccharothrix saharensis]|uniref:hypothetical protein n=1 Tax=Saccharothrix saharensis TaxID=571190 RepID=UPI0036B7920A